MDNDILAAIRLLESHGYQISPPASDDGTVEISDGDFETLWNLYQKKVGKQKCLKLWMKMSRTDKRKCLDYVPLYVEAQPDKQYRKNLETFLRNRCWEDELIYKDNVRQRIGAVAQRIDDIKRYDASFKG